MTTLLLGFTISTIIALLAFAKKSLSESGALAAIFVGTVIYFTLGWFAFLYLIVFFGSATALNVLDDNSEPSQRNALQVLANALLATLFAVLYAFTDQSIYIFLYFLSVAASASDTWASDVGKLSKRLPRNLLTWRMMQTGLSGGVTLLGFIASMFASALFALLAWIALGDVTLVVYLWLFATLASIIDSALGVVQVKYLREGKITEDRRDGAKRHSGIAWLNNNLVNILSNALTIGLFVVLFGSRLF